MLELGQEAPDFTLSDTDGTKVTLSALRGENVVLVFYPLAFSPICTGELKELTAHSKQYADLKAKVVAVSVDSHYTLSAYKKNEALGAVLLADFHPKGEVAKKYGVYMEQAGIAKRGTFVIDKSGVIRGITINEPGAARNEADYFKSLASCAL